MIDIDKKKGLEIIELFKCNPKFSIKLIREAMDEVEEYKKLKSDIKKFKTMARPTKAEQERRRIAGLLAEGKGPDGELLSHLLLNPKGVCKYCSSTFEITHGSQKFCPERNGKKNLCSNRYYNAKKKRERDSENKKEINHKEVEKVLNGAKNNKKYTILELEKEILTTIWKKEIDEMEYSKLLIEKKIVVRDLPNDIKISIRDLKMNVKKFRQPSPHQVAWRKAADNDICKKIETWMEIADDGMGVCLYCSDSFKLTNTRTDRKFCPEKNGKMGFCKDQYHREEKDKRRIKTTLSETSIPETEPFPKKSKSNQIAIAIAVASFLMSLFNLIW